jgi:hypothetical protein
MSGADGNKALSMGREEGLVPNTYLRAGVA